MWGNIGLVGVTLGLHWRMMENQIEKKMETEVETGVILLGTTTSAGTKPSSVFCEAPHWQFAPMLKRAPPAQVFKPFSCLNQECSLNQVPRDARYPEPVPDRNENETRKLNQSRSDTFFSRNSIITACLGTCPPLTLLAGNM